jgi:hypothetical protein
MPRILKLLQERVGTTLEHIGISDNFLNRTPIAQQLKEKIENWDYMKLKSFWTAKKLITRLKRQPTERVKIFASYKSDKGLIT